MLKKNKKIILIFFEKIQKTLKIQIPNLLYIKIKWIIIFQQTLMNKNLKTGSIKINNKAYTNSWKNKSIPSNLKCSIKIINIKTIL